VTEPEHIVDAQLRADALTLEAMGASLRDAAYGLAEADGCYTVEARDEQLDYARLMLANALRHVDDVRAVARRFGVEAVGWP